MNSKDIIRDLIEKITSEEIHADSRLPSESKLSIDYNCNRHTIRKAIEVLIEKGYLIKTYYGATYVNKDPSKHYLNLSSLFDTYNARDIKTYVTKFKLITAPDHISNSLKIDKGSKVWSIFRIRYVADIPDHLEEVYMPYSLFPELTLKECEASILSYIENKCGYEISHAQKNITAIRLTDNECNLLKLPQGALALQIEQTGYLTNGRPYDYSLNRHRDNNIAYYAKR